MHFARPCSLARLYLYTRMCPLSTFKKRAPHAMKSIKKFAQQHMGTTDVRLDPTLNEHVWARGVKNVPRRIRVRLARKRVESEEDAGAEGALYTLVTPVLVNTFKGGCGCGSGCGCLRS